LLLLMIQRADFYKFVLLCLFSTAGFAVYFQCNRLIVINLQTQACGMGNQMFRYAAAMGLAERHPDFYICWQSWDMGRFLTHQHEGSFVLDHASPAIVVPQCTLWTTLTSELMLNRFAPPFSRYVPFNLSSSSSSGSSMTLVNGPMETFRYFPSVRPVFHLNARDSARSWMRERNLTSAIHVRRGDYASHAAPLGFYMRNMVPNAVVVTDEPDWVRFHQSVFKHCVLSEGHDPGFDMALLAAATDTVVIGIGTFAWWGAYLSDARHVIYYGRQAGFETSAFVESDRMPTEWLNRL
jgi:hypothetical protein